MPSSVNVMKIRTKENFGRWRLYITITTERKQTILEYSFWLAYKQSFSAHPKQSPTIYVSCLFQTMTEGSSLLKTDVYSMHLCKILIDRK